ncbi:MAG: hypothetical protein ABEL76_01110, partial [Bradymonadaceae bacterium]
DKFELYSRVPLRFSVYLTDVDRRFSVELTSDGARAVEGSFIDFPLVTLEGTTDRWDEAKGHAQALLEEIDHRLEQSPPDDQLHREFLDDFERLDGVIEVGVLEGEGDDEPHVLRLVLNNYEEPGYEPRSVRATGPIDRLYEVVEGDRSAAEAARSLDLEGDVGPALDLGGMVMSHYPQLD